MAEKKLKARIIHKHETEADWELSSLIPFQGEIIIYDKDENYDYERIKIGDGVTNVNELPFANGITKEYVDEEIENINLVKIVNSLPEEGLPNQIYLVPSSEKFDNTYEEYVWVFTNDTLKMSQGDLVGTINSDYSEWVDTVEWISLDNNFTPYGQYAPIDNRDNLYTYIDSFSGVSAGLMLSDGTNYYSIYACDYTGGAIWAYIKNNKLYVSYDGVNISSYNVTENTKIIGISCYGEGFVNDQITIYECIVMTEGWESVGLRHDDLVDYATKDYVTKNHLKTKVVSILPDVSEAEENIIYIVEKMGEEKELLTTSNNAIFSYGEGNTGPSNGENIEILDGDASYRETDNRYTIYFEQYYGDWTFDEGFEGAYLIDGNTMVFNYEDGIYSNIRIYGKKPYYEEYLFINGAFEPVGPSLNNYATKDYVDEEIATFDFIKVVDSLESVTTPLVNRIYFVPKKSDDLEQENDLFDEYIWMNIGTEADPVYDWEWITTKQLEIDLTNYVEKEDGKGLSTNDFTNAHKTKLDSIVTNDTPKTIDGDITGEIISVNDVHPVEQGVEVKLSSKNLINSNKVFSGGNIYFGVTNYNQYITLPAGEYTFSVVTADGTTTNVYAIYASDNSNIKVTWGGTSVTFTLTEETNVKFKVYKNGYTSANDIISAQVEQGSTATPYTPYIDNFEDVTVSAMGKNLITTKKQYVENIQSIYLNTTAYWRDFTTLPAGTYTLSVVCADGGIVDSMQVTNKSYANIKSNTKSNSLTFELTETTTIMLKCRATRFTSIDDVVSAQLELGSTATDYEPYIEPVTYTPNADGTVEGLVAIKPNMSIFTDTAGVLVNAKYNKDINKTINLAPFGDEDRQIATIGDINNSELITIEDIDIICGSTISYVDLSEGEF